MRLLVVPAALLVALVMGEVGARIGCKAPPDKLLMLEGTPGETLMKLPRQEGEIWTAAFKVDPGNKGFSGTFDVTENADHLMIALSKDVDNMLTSETKEILVITCTINNTDQNPVSFNRQVQLLPKQKSAEHILQYQMYRKMLQEDTEVARRKESNAEVAVAMDTSPGSIVFTWDNYASDNNINDKDAKITPLSHDGDQSDFDKYFHWTDGGRLLLKRQLVGHKQLTYQSRVTVEYLESGKKSSESMPLTVVIKITGPNHIPSFQKKDCATEPCGIRRYTASINEDHNDSIPLKVEPEIYAEDPDGDVFFYSIDSGEPSSYTRYFFMDKFKGDVYAWKLHGLHHSTTFNLKLKVLERSKGPTDLAGWATLTVTFTAENGTESYDFGDALSERKNSSEEGGLGLGKYMIEKSRASARLGLSPLLAIPWVFAFSQAMMVYTSR